MFRRDMGPPEITGGYPDDCPRCGAPDGYDCSCYDCERCNGTGYVTFGDDMIHHATMQDCPDCNQAEADENQETL